MSACRCLYVGLLLLVLAAAACLGPGKPVSTVDTPTAGEEPLLRLATILRAEDRRIGDGTVLSALSAPEPEIRARAVLALARIGDADSRGELEAALGDPSSQVRAQAAFGLGLLGDPTAVSALARSTSDQDAEVRAATARALGMLRDPSAAQPLLILLGDSNAQVQAEAALAAARLGDPSFAVEMLIDLSSSTGGWLQYAAAYSLGRLGASVPTLAREGMGRRGIDAVTRRRVREHLLTLAIHPNPVIRMQVARGLAVPVTPAEISAVSKLGEDPDRRVRLNAIRSLCYPGAPVRPALGKSLQDPDPHLAWTAIEGLGRVGGAEASDILVDRIINAGLPWLQERAVLSLNEASPQLAAQVANGISKDPEAVLRAATAAALAGSEQPQAKGLAARLLRDPDPRVRAAAIPGVAGTTGLLSKKLGDAARSPEPLVRAAVARMAGQRLARIERSDAEIEDAFQVLRQLWDQSRNDPLLLTRQEVLDAASRFGRDARVRELLEFGLQDPDRRVRVQSIRHFAALYGEDRADRAGPAADLPLKEYVKILRWAQRPRAAIVTVERPGFKPGRFTLRLDTEAAPLTCWNFASLAEQGFYDRLVIHRVVPNFVVQDGDPHGDGHGGPGYAIRDEINPASFEAGTLGMAATGRDLAGSQWFITLTAQPHLQGRYTAFGRVAQNFAGVVALLLPGDRVVSIRIYEGDGTEPLPPLE